MTTTGRLLLHLAFLYTCIEGLVINILYPAKLPYLYKDFLILAVYVSLAVRNPELLVYPSRTMTRIAQPAACFALIVGLFMLKPGGTDFGALVAVKQRLFYILLIAAAYHFVEKDDDVTLCLLLVSVYAIGVSIFGVYLYFTGPGGLRALGAYYSAEVFTAADIAGATNSYWRVPATFTSAGQYGAYLMFSGLAGVAVLTTPQVARRWRLLAALSLAMVILAMLTSGSRAPFILFSASAALVVLASGKVRRLVTVGLLAYAVVAFGFALFGEAVHERFGSIASFEHVSRFQRTYFGQMFIPSLVNEPFGSGLGVATIGARHFSEIKDVDLVESYFGIVGVELGVVGLAIFVWLIGAVVITLVRLRPYVVGSAASASWHCLTVYVLVTILVLPISTAIDHAPTNFYFWFAIGAAIKLAELNWKAQTETGEADAREEAA